MTADSALDVDASLARRDYAGRLADEIARIDSECQQVGVQIDLRRSAVLQADQGVEALEKLAEKQLTEFVAFHERRESLQHEEAWQSQRAAQSISPGRRV
jgi:flagellar biosynthesis chaperone FliJ